MIYTSNLQEPPTLDVDMWRPTSLLEEMSLARTCEHQGNGTPAPEPAARATNGLTFSLFQLSHHQEEWL
jgi:hypothetical protein